MALWGRGTSRRFGKYRLVAQVATGGMAEIFLAYQMGLEGFEKLVIIKRILPNLAKERKFVEMFLDEARIAAMLNHPNVVQIFDLGKVKGQYYIAMEYLSGESLSMVVNTCRKRQVKFPFELAAGVVMQAADGLHHAHSAVGRDGTHLGIVHRDVSPQNVFVLYDGGVKVVDFGVAKAAVRAGDQTQTGALKGKFAYMSPEQILGGDVDGRSDVFSLGIVLWECLTGRKLYREENHWKLMESIVREDAPSPTKINPEIPKALVEIVDRALSRDRAQRYRSAAGLRRDLADYLKQSSSAADSAAIGRFMQDLFVARIAQKRRLIERARDASGDSLEHLLSDLSHYLSDTEPSIPDTTDRTDRTLDFSDESPRAFWRRPVIWIAALVVLIAVGLVVAFTLPERDEIEPTQPVESDLVARSAEPPVAEPPVVEIAKEPPVEELLVRKPAKPSKKRKKKRKKRTARTGTGKLRLTTVPWANIYFEGRKLGQTPLVDVVLPAGRHRLRAVNRKEGIDRVIVVEIRPGERATSSFNFRRGTASVPLP